MSVLINNGGPLRSCLLWHDYARQNALDHAPGGNLHPGTLLGESYLDSQGLVLDGDGDYVLLAYAADLNFTGRPSFTLAGWWQSTLLESYDGMLDRNTLTAFWLANRMYLYWQDAAGGSKYHLSAANSVTATGTWYHLAVVSDGVNVQWYVNGAASGAASAIDRDLKAESNPWRVGMTWGTLTWCWHGRVQQVMIFNRPLPAGEIAALKGVTTPG